MDLTILIPCKNDKDNLEYVIKDIKNKYPDIKILVVFGGDKDFDVGLLNRYSRLSYIIQKKKGYGAALACLSLIDIKNSDIYEKSWNAIFFKY